MMKNNYQITLISPQGYSHAHAFDETARLLQAAFTGLGIDCPVMVNHLADDRVNILLGYHLLRYEEGLKNWRFIPYQLEQLSAQPPARLSNMLKILRTGWRVWDYSVENVRFLKNRNILADHLPLGYHPALQTLPDQPLAERENDILFYGAISQRRKTILDLLLKQSTVKVKVLDGVYGEERDRWIAGSKIVLNIHYYESRILETVRLSYLLNNRCFVLTEESTLNPYRQVGLAEAAYDQLIDRCLYFLHHLEEAERLRREQFRRFSELFPITPALEGILPQ